MKIICTLILSVTTALSVHGAIFQGTVLDKNRNPIQALIYTRENYNWHTKTLGSGYFKLWFPDTVRDSIIIFSPGYETVVTVWESNDSSHTYYLERLPHLSDDDLRSLDEVNLKMLRMYPASIGVYGPRPGQNSDLQNPEYDLTEIWVLAVPEQKSLSASRTEPKMQYPYPTRYPYHRNFWTEYEPVRQYPLPKRGDSRVWSRISIGNAIRTQR